MSKIYLVYIYTSPSGKTYVGQTYREERRKREHLWASYNENQKEYHLPFHRAIRKYGFDNFKYEILENNISGNIIDEREVFWIDKFNSFSNGYNAYEGGAIKGHPGVEFSIFLGNKEIKKKNIQIFCEEENLDYNEVRAAVNYSHYSEFGVYNNGKPKRFEFTFWDNNGTIIRVNHLKKWCVENGVKYMNLYMMLNRKRYSTSQGFNNGK